MSHPPVRSRRRRAAPEEEHENHERWLVSYADMITVLMALFIVLYAMSQVDETKYEQLKEGLAVGFGREDSILNGADPIENVKGVDDPGETTNQLILEQVPEGQREEIVQVVDRLVQQAEQQRRSRAYGDAEAEVDALLDVWSRIDRELRRAGLRDDVRATIDERGLVVSLVSRHVVFEPNVAELTPRGEEVVDTLAPVLASLSEPIEIDGHTNQEPVKPKYYPTDWELSVARAVHVLRRLDEVHRLPAERLRATGFGHTKPLIDPDLPGSQKVNKRVDIIVLSEQPAETRALLGEAYDEVRRQAGLDATDTTDPDTTDPDTNDPDTTGPEPTDRANAGGRVPTEEEQP